VHETFLNGGLRYWREAKFCSIRHRPNQASAHGCVTISLIWLALASLTGCTPDTVPEPATLKPPAMFEATPNASSNLAAEMAWQDYITDPQLKELIKRALAGNLNLRMVALRAEQMRAIYGIQKADLTPTLNASGEATRSRIPADLNASGSALTSNQFQLAVGLSNWEADFWGRIRALNENALENYLANEQGHRAATLSLVSQISLAYLNLRDLDERITLAQQTANSRADSLRIFRRRLELGASSKLEVTEIELLYLQATTLIAQLRQTRAEQAHALSLLVGEPIVLQPSEHPLQADSVFAEIPVGLPSDLLLNRPDISAAEHNLKAARANIEAARAAFLPRIALTASAGTASAELTGLFKDGSQALVFSPTISVPIFDGGRLQASLDLATLRRDEAVANYELSIQSGLREVNDALSARRWLTEQAHSLDTTEQVLLERSRLAKLRYNSGAASYLEVLDAERDLLTASQQFVQVRHAILASRALLYVALGGGSRHLDTPTSNETVR